MFSRGAKGPQVKRVLKESLFTFKVTQLCAYRIVAARIRAEFHLRNEILTRECEREEAEKSYTIKKLNLLYEPNMKAVRRGTDEK